MCFYFLGLRWAVPLLSGGHPSLAPSQPRSVSAPPSKQRSASLRLRAYLPGRASEWELTWKPNNPAVLLKAGLYWCNNQGGGLEAGLRTPSTQGAYWVGVTCRQAAND